MVFAFQFPQERNAMASEESLMNIRNKPVNPLRTIDMQEVVGIFCSVASPTSENDVKMLSFHLNSDFYVIQNVSVHFRILNNW